MRRNAFLLSIALAASLPLVGCAADTAPVAESDEQDIVSFSDSTVLRHLKTAVDGLETGGGEGDPDPYKVTSLKLRAGETLNDDFLVKRLLPRLKGVARTDDPIPAMEDGGSLAEFWSDATAEPNPADYQGDDEGLARAKAQAAKWRAAKPVIESHLTNLRSVHIGYRGSPNGSLETGAVALALVGQTATGRVVAIWGIVIWT